MVSPCLCQLNIALTALSGLQDPAQGGNSQYARISNCYLHVEQK
jgi:hypothetical protein